MKYTTYEELQAENLKQLVLEHKQKCDGETCTISVSFMRPLYETLVKRELTEEESTVFI